MLKPLAHVCAIVVFAFTATATQAAPNDKLTGMPVNADLSFSNVKTYPFCGTQVHQAIYTATRHESLETVGGWYASRLHGFTKIPGAFSQHPSEAFVNADGTKSVQLITITAKGGIDTVIYAENTKVADMSIFKAWLAGNFVSCP